MIKREETQLNGKAENDDDEPNRAREKADSACVR